jgi:thioredoxin-like negative regulator of GroEL
MIALARLYVTTSIFISFVSNAFRFKTRPRMYPSSCLGATRQHVTFKNLEAMINSFEQELVLLAFTSDNCGPCKIQKQELESLAQLDHSLRMLRIDMNQFPKLGLKFNIGKLPCTILVKEKEVVLRADGLITAQELWNQLQLLPPG